MQGVVQTMASPAALCAAHKGPPLTLQSCAQVPLAKATTRLCNPMSGRPWAHQIARVHVRDNMIMHIKY